MRVVLAGAHGKIARLLARQLTARGDSVLGLIRRPEHADEVRADGVEPLQADLEQVDVATLARHLAGVDAAVFSAGAGPGSGSTRKDTVDRAASALLADACETAGVRRFLQVSSKGAGEPNPADVGEVFGAYLNAKRAAEQDLRARELDWTILRPVRLTDDEGTGRVQLAGSVEGGSIPRADVAGVLTALLDEPATAGHTFEVAGGATPIRDAVLAVLP